MGARPRPVSLVAEKAVRLLRLDGRSLSSCTLARELLAMQIADEAAATRVLRSAFGDDPRLGYADGVWSCRSAARAQGAPPDPEPDRVLLALEGGREAPGAPFVILRLIAIRVSGDDVVSACGGAPSVEEDALRLRDTLLEMLDDAVPVVHDPPGSLKALEGWLGEPLDAPISMRMLAQKRLGLPLRHTLDDLLEQLNVHWRESDDPMEVADTLDSCLQALREEDESLYDLRVACGWTPAPVDWSRFAFDRSFLRSLPRVPGTYKFFDADGELLYVGKAKNLSQRVGSYFRTRVHRSTRVQKLLKRVHDVQVEPLHSELEALLREAELIRSERPQVNVQRRVHTKSRVRPTSLLIIEPAAAPHALRTYLLRDGRLIAKIAIGPRGGGLKKVERLLEDQFFAVAVGPTEVIEGTDVDVELIKRWLAANRDRAIAFDPTDMPNAQEVTDRLRWVLQRGGPFDPDDVPVLR